MSDSTAGSLLILALVCSASPGAGRALVDTSASPHVKMRSVELSAVRWTDGFWAERFDLCRRAMLPSVERALLDPQNSEHLVNFKIAAGLAQGPRRSTAWSDGDCYKWLEAVALVYEVTKEPELAALMDEWIQVIGKAQWPDGYIATQISDPAQRLQVPSRHELYCMGHLMTAACVHHRVTGKDDFLKVACKAADYLYARFKRRPATLVHFPWNPSAYMGLVELYRTTGRRRYLELAGILIDNRGSAPGGGTGRNGGTDLTQDRVPIRKEDKAVGHAVCATYLYCGAADLFAETGEKALLDALERVWRDMTGRRMYVTGAIGVGRGTSLRGDPVHEAFGDDYELPSRSAYNETCANIGNAMWNWRMLTLTGQCKYADLAGLVLYNSMLSAVSADGQRFFYCNPLKWTGEQSGPHKHHTAERWSVADCYCCPPQVVRTIAGLNNWVYSVSHDALWVHLYAGCRLATSLGDGREISLLQETDYPWGGSVKLTVEKAPRGQMSLMLRIPAWACGATLKVNGRPWPGAVGPGTYANVRRAWSPGDAVDLELPMRVRLIEAHPNVVPLRNHVAVMRGPLVYCLELPKAENGQAIWDAGVFLPENAQFQATFEPHLLGGLTVLRTTALTRKGRDRYLQELVVNAPAPAVEDSSALYRTFKPRSVSAPVTGTVEIELIPYYAWANRGVSFMEVWIPLAR